VLLVLFNALIPSWPMVAMNAAVALINAWFIAQLLRNRRQRRSSAPPVNSPSASPTA
jgi:hypothetical protein